MMRRGPGGEVKAGKARCEEGEGVECDWEGKRKKGVGNLMQRRKMEECDCSWAGRGVWRGEEMGGVDVEKTATMMTRGSF